MSRRLVFSPAALRQYKKLPAHVRALLKSTMAQRLIQEDSTLEDRNRFRLRRASVHADYELRVEVWRVFYRVEVPRVVVELMGQKDGERLIIEGQEFAL